MTDIATLDPSDAPPTAMSARGGEVADIPLELLPAAVGLRDWLLSEATAMEDPGLVLEGLAERLGQLGISIDRITTAIDALHSEYSGIGRFWSREEGTRYRLFPHGAYSEGLYAASPFAYVHKTGQWLLLDLDETPDSRFGIVPELKAGGYRQYLCVPIVFSNGSDNGISFASRDPAAFGSQSMAIIRFVMPTLAAVMEVRSMHARLDSVLRIYVGDEPHRAILSGTIRRGQVSRIRSAILVADMRDYTPKALRLSSESAVELLNAFFDCLVPPIEAEGGEVLKYMGDGLLAIFRDRGDDTGGAAFAALTAAQQGLARLDAANREGRFSEPVAAGIALHHGEAAYGNVGSGARLDFTVIGRDVNLASRIAELNRELSEPLLMSRAFANHLWTDPEAIGEHRVDGFDEAVALYRPRR